MLFHAARLHALPVLLLAACGCMPMTTLRVSDFGAVGDGTHDDGPAIRKAIGAAQALGEPLGFEVLHSTEFLWELLESGALALKGFEAVVTYHDPCNIARSGWIVDQPRFILRSFVRNFVEMSPAGRENYCCGGGGGTVSVDELHEYRMKVAGKIKAEQIRSTGAEIVATPCANCKKQLRELVDHYNLQVTVVGVHDLVLRAIHLEPQPSDQQGGQCQQTDGQAGS